MEKIVSEVNLYAFTVYSQILHKSSELTLMKEINQGFSEANDKCVPTYLLSVTICFTREKTKT